MPKLLTKIAWSCLNLFLSLFNDSPDIYRSTWHAPNCDQAFIRLLQYDTQQTSIGRNLAMPKQTAGKKNACITNMDVNTACFKHCGKNFVGFKLGKQHTNIFVRPCTCTHFVLFCWEAQNGYNQHSTAISQIMLLDMLKSHVSNTGRSNSIT